MSVMLCYARDSTNPSSERERGRHVSACGPSNKPRYATCGGRITDFRCISRGRSRLIAHGSVIGSSRKRICVFGIWTCPWFRTQCSSPHIQKLPPLPPLDTGKQNNNRRPAKQKIMDPHRQASQKSIDFHISCRSRSSGHQHRKIIQASPPRLIQHLNGIVLLELP
ncbi:hypothetical protein K491DRAFT_72391 [Lophiostoma macrostomum CBS 122681]|uniref:Uncharacterized protein n=1 Tax=Lophiostoma macrostomum CBS 122681 TaxID=1314788 RepID=A0A6A6SWM3_9PLEO|nr:hypothetical protein K491DRAFT_72391 [Lophiostoma macrostomum CBS 122681]